MAKQTFTTGQVLTAAQMTSLQETAMGGGPATAKTASYVLVAADAGTTVAMNAAGATTITVNTGLFAAGDTVFIQNLGAGACTVTAGTATVATAGSLILPQNDAGILYFTATGAAIFYDYIQVGAASPLTTKGDLYTFSTSDTRIGVGANNTVLTADSSQATGLKWATPAGGGKVLQVVSVIYSTQMSTSSTSYQDTNLTLNITPSSATSKILVLVSNALRAERTGHPVCIQYGAKILRGSTDIYINGFLGGCGLENDTALQWACTVLDSPATTSALTYKMQVKCNTSGTTVYAQSYSPTGDGTITLLEIGA